MAPQRNSRAHEPAATDSPALDPHAHDRQAHDRQAHDPRDHNAQVDARRKKLVWESALGFVGFFAAIALIQAVWNVFQPEPSIGPSLLLIVLLGLLLVVWRQYRKF